MSTRLIAEHVGPEAAHRVLTETHRQFEDLGLQPRHARRLRELQLDRIRETHVIVGDHPPEPRRNLDPCDCNDGSTVAQCKGAACKSHNRCCWQ
jgi:hypothetical protein